MKEQELNPSQALQLWHSVVLELVKEDGHDLNQRQLAILLEIYLRPPPHTVRELAYKLNVTKPVITRALDTMGQMGLVNRKRDTADRRNVLIQRTVEGSQFLENLGQLVCEKVKGL